MSDAPYLAEIVPAARSTSNDKESLAQAETADPVKATSTSIEPRTALELI
jgi:hypothetical protein